MRILVSAVVHHEELCESLAAEHGAEVVALSPARIDLGEYGNQQPHVERKRAHRLVALPVAPQRPYPYSMYVRGVASLLREFRPEVLLCIGEPSELGVAQVVRLAKRACPGVRVVLNTLENVPRSWAGFPKALRGRAQTATLARTDMIAAASVSARELLVGQGFPAERIRVVYPGFHAGQFAPGQGAAVRERHGWGERFVVGFVGRLVAEKGVDTLLKTLCGLPERVIVAIVGDGLLEQELRAEAKRLGVEARVEWLGRIERSRISEYMCAFDALVLPSRSLPVWQEQFGRVLAEAMLCGTPVIGSDCGAIPEVIGDAGYVFAEDDVDGLVEKIQRLVDDPGERERLSAAGIERAGREFSHEKLVNSLMEVFEAVLAAPARG